MSHVQFGCGHEAPADWLNFDSSPTLVLERFPIFGRFFSKNAQRFPDCVRRGNIVKGLPVPAGSADAVYCSHTLEHLALDEFRVALKNTYEMLRPGGVFRLVVPDLAYYIKNYNASDAPTAAHSLLEETMLGHPTRPHSLFEFLKNWVGGSTHYWMWDYPAMELELSAVGFTEIRRAHFGDATDPHFKSVENEGRWTNCLGVECARPDLLIEG